MKPTAKRIRVSKPTARIGQVRRFGRFGPAYLIEKITGETCSILIPTSGEKAKLKLAQIINDPVEA